MVYGPVVPAGIRVRCVSAVGRARVERIGDREDGSAPGARALAAAGAGARVVARRSATATQTAAVPRAIARPRTPPAAARGRRAERMVNVLPV